MNSGKLVIFMIKLTLLQNYTHFIITNKHFIKTHTNIIIFDTFDGTIPLRYLRISLLKIIYLSQFVGKKIVNFFFFF